jgi:hypothetical protein
MSGSPRSALTGALSRGWATATLLLVALCLQPPIRLMGTSTLTARYTDCPNANCDRKARHVEDFIFYCSRCQANYELRKCGEQGCAYLGARTNQTQPFICKFNHETRG